MSLRFDKGLKADNAVIRLLNVSELIIQDYKYKALDVQLFPIQSPDHERNAQRLKQKGKIISCHFHGGREQLVRCSPATPIQPHSISHCPTPSLVRHLYIPPSPEMKFDHSKS